VPPDVEHGPPLLCRFDPEAPGFTVLTPAHRRQVPKPGFQVGDARVLPQVIVRYRCTDLWFWPVAVLDVRVHGYVFDRDEAPCR
jgi:hypothetical protein